MSIQGFGPIQGAAYQLSKSNIHTLADLPSSEAEDPRLTEALTALKTIDECKAEQRQTVRELKQTVRELGQSVEKMIDDTRAETEICRVRNSQAGARIESLRASNAQLRESAEISRSTTEQLKAAVESIRGTKEALDRSNQESEALHASVRPILERIQENNVRLVAETAEMTDREDLFISLFDAVADSFVSVADWVKKKFQE
jgi:ABC-type transporter Mla subunit MlaD